MNAWSIRNLKLMSVCSYTALAILSKTNKKAASASGPSPAPTVGATNTSTSTPSSSGKGRKRSSSTTTLVMGKPKIKPSGPSQSEIQSLRASSAEASKKIKRSSSFIDDSEAAERDPDYETGAEEDQKESDTSENDYSDDDGMEELLQQGGVTQEMEADPLEEGGEEEDEQHEEQGEEEGEDGEEEEEVEQQDGEENNQDEEETEADGYGGEEQEIQVVDLSGEEKTEDQNKTALERAQVHPSKFLFLLTGVSASSNRIVASERWGDVLSHGRDLYVVPECIYFKPYSGNQNTKFTKANSYAKSQVLVAREYWHEASNEYRAKVLGLSAQEWIGLRPLLDHCCEIIQNREKESFAAKNQSPTSKMASPKKSNFKKGFAGKKK